MLRLGTATGARQLLPLPESETLRQRGEPAPEVKESAEVTEALGEWGYRDVSGKGRHYAREDGHTCSVKSDGSWSHSGAMGGYT